MAKSGAPDDWVPATCTLPTVEQPLRLAEFDEFFRTAVQRSVRPRTTTLDLVISPESEAFARSLAERETACCAFFNFDISPAEDGLVMRIGVPESHVDVLDALHHRVSTVAGCGASRLTVTVNVGDRDVRVS